MNVEQGMHAERRIGIEQSSEGIVARAIRSHQLWLTLGYFAILFLLVRAYA
jgi:hypothetical protein